jgi:hypothetical protein
MSINFLVQLNVQPLRGFGMNIISLQKAGFRSFMDSLLRCFASWPSWLLWCWQLRAQHFQLSCSGNRFLTKSRLMWAMELHSKIRIAFAIGITSAPHQCSPKRHAASKNTEKLINARLEIEWGVSWKYTDKRNAVQSPSKKEKSKAQNQWPKILPIIQTQFQDYATGCSFGLKSKCCSNDLQRWRHR